MVWLVAVLCLASMSTAHAEVAYSPDHTVSIAGLTVNDENVVFQSASSVAVSAALPAISSDAELSALTYDGPDVLFTVDITSIIEGVTVEPRDVVRWDGLSVTTLLDGSAIGIPNGLKIDALTLSSSGNLLVSFDSTAQVGSVTAEDEDLVRLFPSPLLVFDGSAEGIDPSLDLNGAGYTSAGLGLLSFDGSGIVGGFDFDDEDILSWDPLTGSFALMFDGSAIHPALVEIDLTAIPEPSIPASILIGALYLASWTGPRNRTSKTLAARRPLVVSTPFARTARGDVQ